MRNSMAVAAAGFGLTLLTLPYLGNHGLWLALAVFLSLRGLSLAVIWHRHWRNNTVSSPARYIVTVKDSEYKNNYRILNYNNNHVQQKRT